MKILVWVLAVILVILCAVTLFLEKSIVDREEESKLANTGELQNTYSWEEYQALSLEDQDAYFQTFDSVESFEAWMEAAKPTESVEPDLVWNKPGKTPDAYTWEEYQSLNAEEKEAFCRWFASVEAFDAWMETVKPKENMELVAKWDKPGKTPDAYTWEEYQALTSKEQEAFFLWFDSLEAFEAWMKAVKPVENTETVIKWEKPGKAPDAYTWEEYQKLSPEEQDAFYQWFGSEDAFEKWMEAVKPTETTLPALKWDKAKEPSKYTWEEYQKLTPKEQDAFYQWFGSLETFEAWMESVKPQESIEQTREWNKPGKTPDACTWEEYQALSPAEKDVFFLWFGSVDAFEAWMEKVTDN